MWCIPILSKVMQCEKPDFCPVSLKLKEVVFQWQDKNLQWTVTTLPDTFHTRSRK